FMLEANNSAGDITEARLFFSPTGSSVRSSEPIRFDAAPSVSLSHEWIMQQNGVPPGAEIGYFWRLTDSAGNEYETPEQRIVALDPRFEWQTVEDEELAVYWYDGGADWGQEIFETGKQALAQLEEELGTPIEQQVRVAVYGSSEAFRDAFPPQQEWIGGAAFPDIGVTVQIIDAGDRAWMKVVMSHELSHLVFAQVMEGALANSPAWLDEGLAMYNEPDGADELRGRESADNVRAAADANSLLRFSQLQGNFGADSQVVGLAYAQSEMLVT
ncbi:MAG: peptidase MA family metallohydrolase, partial [Ardenticatenaceae bacterium]